MCCAVVCCTLIAMLLQFYICLLARFEAFDAMEDNARRL